MEIQFQSTGATAAFESWLKCFKDISESLLLEIDINEQQFVAKSYTADKTIVKYGTAAFSDMGLEVSCVKDKTNKKLTLDEWKGTGETRRVLFPLLMTLDKFVKLVGIYKGTDNYKFNVKFSESDDKLLVSKAELKSLTLTTMIQGSEITEFKVITDDQFNNHIASIPNPIAFDVSTDALKNLQNVASVYSNDPKKDILEFKVCKDAEAWTLYAYDHNTGSYNQKMAYLNADAETPVETTLPIVRNNLILATKNDTDNAHVTVPGNADGPGDKIRIDSGTFTTIIASVRVD